MDQINEFLQGNISWIVVIGELLLLIALMVLIHKINVMKAQTEKVTKNVENYLRIIMESEEEEEPMGNVKKKKNDNPAGLDEEAQNRLISSVLQEIFP